MIAHGDFCGWNTSVLRNGKLAIWDWEWAHLGEPLEDWFHWETQRLVAFGALSIERLVRQTLVPSPTLHDLCERLGLEAASAVPTALRASLRHSITRLSSSGGRELEVRTRMLEAARRAAMKVLISAYICAPHRGSEPGAGWNWSLAAAEENEVWVLTRERNRAAIEAELAAHPHPRLHFVYVELPPWGLRLKKGERGIRYFSYYTLWQFAALRKARKLHAELGFDLVHHVTFANMWLPALVGFVEAPFVLGPVGGGPRVPFRLYPELGAVGAAREIARGGLQTACRLNPLTRASWSRADDDRRPEWRDSSCASSAPPIAGRRSIECIGSAIVDPHRQRERSPNATRRARTALLAGRLVPWKGGSLALRAIARTSDWSLTVIGGGPDHGRLTALAAQSSA